MFYGRHWWEKVLPKKKKVNWCSFHFVSLETRAQFVFLGATCWKMNTLDPLPTKWWVICCCYWSYVYSIVLLQQVINRLSMARKSQNRYICVCAVWWNKDRAAEEISVRQVFTISVVQVIHSSLNLMSNVSVMWSTRSSEDTHKGHTSVCTASCGGRWFGMVLESWCSFNLCIKSALLFICICTFCCSTIFMSVQHLYTQSVCSRIQQ